MFLENSPQNRHPIHRSLPESSIPSRKQRVSKSNHVSNVTLVRFLEEVGFSSFGIDVGVSSEEGHEGAGLVPSDEEVGGGVLRRVKREKERREGDMESGKEREREREETKSSRFVRTPKKPPTSARKKVESRISTEQR